MIQNMQVPQEQPDPLDLLDPQAPKEPQVQVQLEQLVQVQPEPLDHKDQQVLQGHKGRPEPPV